MSDIISIPQKQCSVCLQYFPPTTEYFHARKATKKDGLSPCCKTCANKNRRKNWHANPERNHDYKQANKARDKARLRERYANDPDYRAKAIKKSHISYWKDVDLTRKRMRDYARSHSAEAVARAKKWAEDNPERYKALFANRYALEKNAVGSYSMEDLLHLYDEQEGRCAYCGISIYWTVKNDIHVDHVLALSRGGTNWPDNLALACRDCNCSKKEKTVEEWLQSRDW